MKRNACATILVMSAICCFGCGGGGGGAPPPHPIPSNGWSPQNPTGVVAPSRAAISLDGGEGKAETTRNLIFVYDGSGSMGDPFQTQIGGTKFASKMDGANWAVHEFVKTLSDDANIGLVVFTSDNAAKVLLPLQANNKAAFLTAVDSVRPETGTPLGEAIIVAVDTLTAQYKKQLGYGEFRIIVVTDGKATGNTSISTAAKYAESYGFPIYTIGLDVGEGHELRNHSVKYFAASSAEDLQKGLSEAAAETETFDTAEFKQ